MFNVFLWSFYQWSCLHIHSTGKVIFQSPLKPSVLNMYAWFFYDSVNITDLFLHLFEPKLHKKDKRRREIRREGNWVDCEAGVQWIYWKISFYCLIHRLFSLFFFYIITKGLKNVFHVQFECQFLVDSIFIAQNALCSFQRCRGRAKKFLRCTGSSSGWKMGLCTSTCPWLNPSS